MSPSPNGHRPGLTAVTYHNPQGQADRLVPLGWCNFCIGLAKATEAAGEPPVTIHAAVTIIPHVHVIGVGGQSVQYPMPTPACWEHLGAKRASSLIPGG